MNRSSDQRGQTMIELLAAIFVISFALVSTLALATSNLKNQAIGAARLTASHLARESVELARNIRDTNWLSDVPPDKWNLGLHDPNGTRHCAVTHTEGADMTFTFLDCPASANGVLDVFDERYRLYRDADGTYFQTGAVQGVDTKTSMHRTLRLDPICLTLNGEGLSENVVLSGPDGDCAGGDQRIGVQVTSSVAWKMGGGTHSVTVAQDLLNWR